MRLGCGVYSFADRIELGMHLEPAVLGIFDQPGHLGLPQRHHLQLVRIRIRIERGIGEPAVTAERSMTRARDAIETLLRNDAPDASEHGTPATAAAACLHFVSALEAAARVAEQALVRDFATEPEDAAKLASLRSLLVEGVDAVLDHVAGRGTVLIEDARAREIRLNALAETAAREGGRAERTRDAVAYRLWFGELAVAYEAAGNQLYRLAASLDADA